MNFALQLYYPGRFLNAFVEHHYICCAEDSEEMVTGVPNLLPIMTRLVLLR